MIQRLIHRFDLVQRLRVFANWLEERSFRRRPFVLTDEMVQRDIRRILEQWPRQSFNYNTIYCRSSCGVALKKGLEDAVRVGVISQIAMNGETRYSWVGS